MDKRSLLLISCAAALLLTACEGATVPERREVLGSWVSQEMPGTTIRMTLAETARSVDGAGHWLSPADARAFRVFGALARDEVSLLLDFGNGETINFQGFFRSADSMQGLLTGNGFREQGISFDRETLVR
jgi:hypothetical protein